MLLVMLAITQALMTKVLFAKGGPKCLDGTQAGYYIQQNKTSNQFVIYLEGGGVCQTALDCSRRKRSALGSSNYWRTTRNGYELVSTNAETNPDFFSWNHIWIPYCSGDIWIGQEDAPINPFRAGADNYTFQGHLIMEAMLDQKIGLKEATHVLLTGCSAGGIGSFHNADWLAEQLPNAVVKSNPEAGWFNAPFDRFPYFVQGIPDPDPKHLNSTTVTWLKNIQIYQAPAISLCLADPTADTQLCGSVPYFYPYIKTPVFVSEAASDEYQVHHSAGMPNELNATEKKYIVKFGNYLRDNLEKVVMNGKKAETDGIFTPACFKHCLPWNAQVDGHTWRETLGNWYFEREGVKQLLDKSQDINKFLSC